jgi:hypothetical protein
MTRKNKRPAHAAEIVPTLDDIIASIIKNCGSPERVMELYYLAHSPGTLELVRAIAAMPPATRSILEQYLTVRRDPADLRIRIEDDGEISIFCPAAADVIRAISAPKADTERLH